MQFVMKAIAGGGKFEKLLAFVSDFRWTERSQGNKQSCEVQKGVGQLRGDTTGKAGLGHLLPDLYPKEL